MVQPSIVYPPMYTLGLGGHLTMKRLENEGIEHLQKKTCMLKFSFHCSSVLNLKYHFICTRDE